MRHLGGSIYDIYTLFHKLKSKMLWCSQQKKLKDIGSFGYAKEPLHVVGYEYISIGDNFFAGKDVRLEAWDKYGEQKFSPSIIIGNSVTFTDRCYISCIDKVEIGDGVLLGRDVFITDNSHGDTNCTMFSLRPVMRPLTSKGNVIIGKNVWIGRQATILSGVTIGDNSIIGANSVVNTNIPDNCIAVGNPARIIKRIIDTD